MAEGIININSADLVKLTNRLEKIGRADLPVAVRSTLNQMAFTMKGERGKRGEIDVRAEKDFEYRRNKTLFKAMTGATKAQGLNIDRMKSEAGIINRTGKTELAEGLADQQKGGQTKQKATPLNKSRVGNNRGRKVRQKYLLNQINNAYKIKRQRGRRFIQLALRAERTGRPVLITGKRGDNYLAYITKFYRNNRGIDFEFDWKYRINRDGKINLGERHPFIERAAKVTGRKLSKEFVKQANKRINKTFKK